MPCFFILHGTKASWDRLLPLNPPPPCRRRTSSPVTPLVAPAHRLPGLQQHQRQPADGQHTEQLGDWAGLSDADRPADGGQPLLRPLPRGLCRHQHLIHLGHVLVSGGSHWSSRWGSPHCWPAGWHCRSHRQHGSCPAVGPSGHFVLRHEHAKGRGPSSLTPTAGGSAPIHPAPFRLVIPPRRSALLPSTSPHQPLNRTNAQSPPSPPPPPPPPVSPPPPPPRAPHTRTHTTTTTTSPPAALLPTTSSPAHCPTTLMA